MKERVRQAAEMLKAKLAEDDELSRMAGTLLFSYKLSYWLISEICAREGMTNEMAQWLIQSQDMAAKKSFDFIEMMADMKQVRLPWLESRRREAVARQATLQKRMKAMSAAIRRQDIPLPWHSMTTLFEEDGFRHGDSMVVFGETEALNLVLRRCAQSYYTTGGRVLFLSKQREEEYKFADRVVSSSGWRNTADIQASLDTFLKPLLKPVDRKPVGLVVIDDLEHMLTNEVYRTEKANRRARLHRAYMIVKQHQVDHGYALIIGVPTDEDPGAHPDELYSEEMLNDNTIRLALSEPLIVGGEPVVAIGNDTETMAEMRRLLKEKE
jgi:hypothetical protein